MIREACFLSTLVKDGLKREKRKNTYFQSLLNGFLFPFAQCKKRQSVQLLIFLKVYLDLWYRFKYRILPYYTRVTFVRSNTKITLANNMQSCNLKIRNILFLTPIYQKHSLKLICLEF